MLGATVNVPSMKIENGKVVMVTERLSGYKHYKIGFNAKTDEILPSSVSVHEDEIVVMDEEEVIELGEPKFNLGDKVKVADPINLEGIVFGIAYSSSGCIEYEVLYKSREEAIKQTFPDVLLEKVGTAAEAGTQTGSMEEYGIQRLE